MDLTAFLANPPNLHKIENETQKLTQTNNACLYIGECELEDQKVVIIWKKIDRLDEEMPSTKATPESYKTVFGNIEDEFLEEKPSIVQKIAKELSISKEKTDYINYNSLPYVIKPGFIQFETNISPLSNSVYLNKMKWNSIYGNIPINQDSLLNTDADEMSKSLKFRVYFNISYPSKTSKTIGKIPDNPLFVFLTSPPFCQTLLKPTCKPTGESQARKGFEVLVENDIHCLTEKISAIYDCLTIDPISTKCEPKFYNDTEYLKHEELLNEFLGDDFLDLEYIEKTMNIIKLINYFLLNPTSNSSKNNGTSKRRLVVVSNIFTTELALTITNDQMIKQNSSSVFNLILSDSACPLFNNERYVHLNNVVKTMHKYVSKICNYDDDNDDDNNIKDYKIRLGETKSFLDALIKKDKSYKKEDLQRNQKILEISNQIINEEYDNEKESEQSEENLESSNTSSSSSKKTKSEQFGLKGPNIFDTEVSPFIKNHLTNIMSGITSSIAFVEYRKRACNFCQYCMDDNIFGEVLLSADTKIHDYFGDSNNVIEFSTALANSLNSIKADNTTNENEQTNDIYEKESKILLNDFFNKIDKNTSKEILVKNKRIDKHDLSLVDIQKKKIESTERKIIWFVNHEIDNDNFYLKISKTTVIGSTKFGFVECLEQPNMCFDYIEEIMS